MKNMQILKELKANKDEMDSKMKKLEDKEKEKEDQTKLNNKSEEAKTESNPPPASYYDPLEDDMLFGNFMSGIDINPQIGSFEKSDVVGANAPKR